ncbi:hypothetical protein ABW19_dt0208799 [Dactylella cylindrospora]|nr:hypothetical protein ABW19_dt0208799 [Dactylella cylindrospora]
MFPWSLHKHLLSSQPYPISIASLGFSTNIIIPMANISAKVMFLLFFYLFHIAALAVPMPPKNSFRFSRRETGSNETVDPELLKWLRNANQTALREMILKPRTIAPADPCRHPNPVFPDEGGPSEVWGCNSHPLAADGTCPFVGDKVGKDASCASYCEVRREYYYGKEERWLPADEIFPYPDSPEVVVTEGEALTVGWIVDFGFSLDFGIVSGKVGAAKIETTTYMTTRMFRQPPWNEMAPYCGFFTFLPKMVRSCGTISKWEKVPIATPGSLGGAIVEICDTTKPPTSYGNMCTEFPWLNSEGKVEGATIVAKVVCGDEQTLAPACAQDKKYRLKGVVNEALVRYHPSDLDPNAPPACDGMEWSDLHTARTARPFPVATPTSISPTEFSNAEPTGEPTSSAPDDDDDDDDDDEGEERDSDGFEQPEDRTGEPCPFCVLHGKDD